MRLRVRHPTQQPNKRLRKAAWREVDALLRQGELRDRQVIECVRARVAVEIREGADRLYGAQKYGRDVTQPLIIPFYGGKPPEQPEHGFTLIAVAGKRKHLWCDERWVEVSGALLREVGSHGLRTALAHACRFQEARVWANHATALKFRDQIINVKHFYQNVKDDKEWWPHASPQIGVGRP